MSRCAMADGAVAVAGDAERFFDRLPPHIAKGLTPEQYSAIARAAGHAAWTGHPVNIRITIPLLFKNCYLTILAGADRRNRERRIAERAKHPVRTAGNLMFVFAGAGLFYIAAVLGFLFYSSILEY